MLSQPASKSVSRSAFVAPKSAKANWSCPEPPETVSLPTPPRSQSAPSFPPSVSFPAPPRTVSAPPPPWRKSLPPLPLIKSASAPPMSVSLPSVPLNVAMSDHPNVWRSDGRCALYGCDELRIRAARTVRVVIELSARCVVDDAIVRIVSTGGARAGKKPRISGREMARPAEPAEGARVEAQGVPIGVEVEQRVRIAGAEFAEHVAILARAARELIVATTAFYPVVAGVAEDRVVAGGAHERVIAARAADVRAGADRCWRGRR